MKFLVPFVLTILVTSCLEKNLTKNELENNPMTTVKLMTLDPGHFHASLVHKSMYPQVDSTIYVFAPHGTEVDDFLNKIKTYNSKEEQPTGWKVKAYLSDEYVSQMITEKPGNVMIVAGKNSKKIDYIIAAVNAGLNVYADKPLVINSEGFKKLKRAFEIAAKNDVLIYDIMTERFEVTTMLQKKISSIDYIFGKLIDGTPDHPAISKESVHHFFKYVSGKPLVRPPWFFDVNQEGEGIVDVTTHLVDLIQWEAFDNQIVDSTEIEMLNAKRWPTILSRSDFTKVTDQKEFPTYLEKDLENNKLKVFSNGEMNYKIKGKHAKVSVLWNFEAPEGTGDTHYSIMRGSKSDLIIKQGPEENFKPVLYLKSHGNRDFDSLLNRAIVDHVQTEFPGTYAEQLSDEEWRIHISDRLKIGHEAHFAQVTKNYLEYLEKGQLPDWEIPNIITKYYTTIAALEMAKKVN